MDRLHVELAHFPRNIARRRLLGSVSAGLRPEGMPIHQLRDSQLRPRDELTRRQEARSAARMVKKQATDLLMAVQRFRWNCPSRSNGQEKRPANRRLWCASSVSTAGTEANPEPSVDRENFDEEGEGQGRVVTPPGHPPSARPIKRQMHG